MKNVIRCLENKISDIDANIYFRENKQPMDRNYLDTTLSDLRRLRNEFLAALNILKQY